jgi:hypothetical protein
LTDPDPEVLSVRAEDAALRNAPNAHRCCEGCAMVIALPFLQMFERYNGMTMAPQDALEQAIANAPAEEPADEAVATEIPAPQLTLVVSR